MTDVAGGSGDDSFVNSPIMGVDFANGGEGQDLFQWVGDSGIFKLKAGLGVIGLRYWAVSVLPTLKF